MSEPLKTFAQRGHTAYLHHVKAAQTAVTTAAEAVALGPLASAFVAAVVGSPTSLEGKLDGSVRVGLNDWARFQLGTVTARKVDEGGVKPIGKITFRLSNAPPEKIVGEIIVSAEALRELDEQTQAAIRQSLVEALAGATNTELVDLFTSGASTRNNDPAALLSAISGGAPRRPYLIAGFDGLLALPAGRLRDLRDLGVTIIPCAEATGYVIAIDAAGLLIAGGDDARVEIARHAQVTMDDGTNPPSSGVVDLWGRNLAAVRAERFLRFDVAAGAVAYASTGSPS